MLVWFISLAQINTTRVRQAVRQSVIVFMAIANEVDFCTLYMKSLIFSYFSLSSAMQRNYGVEESTLICSITNEQQRHLWLLYIDMCSLWVFEWVNNYCVQSARITKHVCLRQWQPAQKGVFTITRLRGPRNPPFISDRTTPPPPHWNCSHGHDLAFFRSSLFKIADWSASPDPVYT